MQCRTSLLASLCWHINCLASNLQIIAQSCISRWKILHTSSKGWKVREGGGGKRVMRRLAMAAAAADLGANLMESGASFNAKRGTMARDVQGQWTMRQTCARQTPLPLFPCSPFLYHFISPSPRVVVCSTAWPVRIGFNAGGRGEGEGERERAVEGIRVTGYAAGRIPVPGPSASLLLFRCYVPCNSPCRQLPATFNLQNL